MSRLSDKPPEARLWYVRGRVQGVGYRTFAQRAAVTLGLTGYARNLDDGRVEVYAVGSAERLSDMAGQLYRGPRWCEVRGVDEEQAAIIKHDSFRID